MPEARPCGRIQCPQIVAAGVVQHPVGDQRREAAVAVLPDLAQARVAAAVESKLQGAGPVAIDDESPGAAVRRVDPHRGGAQHLAALRHRDHLELAASLARRAVEGIQVEQSHPAVLPRLQRQVRVLAPCRRRQQCGRGRADIGVLVLQRLVLGRSVGAERIAVGPGPIRIKAEDGVAPVVSTRVEGTVPCGYIDPVSSRVVGHCSTGPDRRLHGAAIVLAGPALDAILHEVDRQVAAVGVEDVLAAGGQIDGGQVALVIAIVAGIAAVGHVEVARAVPGGGDRQGGGALLVEALEGGRLRPAAPRHLRAIANRVLMHPPVERAAVRAVAVQAIAVDVLPVRVDRRRGGGVAGRAAGGAGGVDVAGAGGAVRPHSGPGVRVEGDDAAGPGGHEYQVATTTGGSDAGEIRWRAIDGRAEIGLEQLGQARHIGGADRSFLGVVAAVLRVAVELRPVVGSGRGGRPEMLRGQREQCRCSKANQPASGGT